MKNIIWHPSLLDKIRRKIHQNHSFRLAMAKPVFFSTILFFGLLSIVQSSPPGLSPEVAPKDSTVTGPRRRPMQVRCRNPSFRSCRRIQLACPPGCPFDCSVDCASVVSTPIKYTYIPQLYFHELQIVAWVLS